MSRILLLLVCQTVLLAGQTPSLRISGTLREAGDQSLVVATADKGVVRVRTSDRTKYFREDKEIRALFLQAGDALDLKAIQESDGTLLALEVRLQARKADEPKPAKEDDDFTPPRLSRGIPSPAPPAASRRVEAERPSAPAAPKPPADPRAAMIERARDMAENFSEVLPNYICQQFTTRYDSRTRPVSWQARDVVSAEVVYEDGKESYRKITVNGKPFNKKMEEMEGSWSTGEFGTILRNLFAPSLDAKFKFRRESVTSHQSAMVYDFEVSKANSHWEVTSGTQTILPAYRGAVWIDMQTSRALRIEMEAVNLPESFPLNTVETAVDYDFVMLGAEKFLLPVHSENLSCLRGSSYCGRNVIDFRNYHKYAGESKITFTP